MYKKIVSIAVCSALLTACNDSNDSPVIEIPATPPAEKVTLTEGSLTLTKSLGDVVFTKGGVSSAPLALDVGFGSGAYHRAGDDSNVFYTITDRGPNIKCSDTNAVFGIEDFCMPGGDKVFPQPDFTPTIYKIKLTKAESGAYGYEVLEELPLKNTLGENISGITNNLTVTDSETSIGTDGELIDYDNAGLDTEAIVRLKDGTFWLTDEYGPSLVHVDVDGTILKRVVPESVATDLDNAGYPVEGLLPDALKHRKLNRGIESIALSEDEKSLYFIMQSPLAFPDANAYKTSSHVRLFKLALTDGDITSVEGEYVYNMDRASSYAGLNNTGDQGKKQSDVKISEMVAVGNDELVILERISGVTKFYRVNLTTGDNILGEAIATGTVVNNESTEEKTLEQVYDLAFHNAKAVSKELVFNTLTDMPAGMTAPTKIEGIAVLDNEHVLLINDNDFGIFGDATKALVLNIADKFMSAGTPIKKPAMNMIARYQSNILGESAAEIVAFHSESKRVYVINAKSSQVDILSGISSSEVLAAPLTATNLTKDASIDVSANITEAGGINSVAVHGNLLAVAVEHDNKQANGMVAFYQLDATTGAATYLSQVAVGALPDNVQFSPDGTKLVVACEGEPSGDYLSDPEGSIAIINIADQSPAASATILGFTDFNAGGSRANELPESVRIFGGAFGGTPSTVAQDLEPEYVAFADDSSMAYVSLQENNAIALVDLSTSKISRIIALGNKDYSQAENALDVSDKDKDAEVSGTKHHNGKGRINITTWDNVVGTYQPDTIASYAVNGVNYIVTANEGDAREYISGELNDDFETQATCEAEGLNWDVTQEACFDGDTPTMCATKGLLNKENEECFSYVEEFRVEDLTISGSYGDFVAPIPTSVAEIADNFSAEITEKITDEALGRLKITTVNALNKATGTVTKLQSYGARSFSIWTESGELVFDSGSDIAKITAGRVGEFFNASNDKEADDKKNDRSSAKGAEPEALTVGEVNGRTYAFVGLERVGGIMMYDITNPNGVQFIEYVINRDFTKDPTESTEAGDVGPEGMKFVPADKSPTGEALLIVGNEVSGSTNVYEIK
ncbi:choice-of-anchor I family protein [Colwellia sp. UCD-KL20]|uniref:choice-of-anchor I family protein n=1 Tax=Colwellia sp. UCD-KL20 TaxID=1917165 RepID=UPI0009707B8F|nr:choice-of-anchor I family protein [Colwellia sp. UCD-KL20]